jgi:predicted metal-dependent phosphoesterase TrpH
LIIDLHVHTRHYSGCSSIEAGSIITRAREAGLDGVVLTEHGILWRAEKFAPLMEEAAKQGLVLLVGQEITCLNAGRSQDFLVFGLKDGLRADRTAKDLIDRVHDLGGVVVAAHPYRASRLGVGYHGAADELYNLPVDAVELYHPDHNEEAHRKVRSLARALGIPMTGGSDAHELAQVGAHATRFFKPVATVEHLVAEIRAANLEPVEGPLYQSHREIPGAVQRE